jgi:hypothetical protein
MVVNKTIYGNNRDVPDILSNMFLLSSPGIRNHMNWQVIAPDPVFPQSYQTILNKQEFIIQNMKKYARAEGVSVGFGVDLESTSDLSRGIGVSEMAECWEKVQHTSARPHVDLVPGRNGTGTRLTCADT